MRASNGINNESKIRGVSRYLERQRYDWGIKTLRLRKDEINVQLRICRYAALDVGVLVLSTLLETCRMLNSGMRLLVSGKGMLCCTPLKEEAGFAPRVEGRLCPHGHGDQSRRLSWRAPRLEG